MDITTQAQPEPKAPVTVMEKAIQDNDLAAFNRAELDRKAGKPEQTVEHDAEAAAAQPVDQAPSTEGTTKAATEAAAPGKTKGKLSAKERKAEIDAEIKELNDRLLIRAELRKQLSETEPKPKQADKPAETASAAEEPAYKKYLKMPNAPKSADFESLDEFGAAMGQFIAEQIAEERANAVYDKRSGKDRESYERDQQFFQQAEEAESRVRVELEADPEILSRIDDRWKALNPSDRLADGERLSPAHFVKDRVTFHSRHTLKLSEWLTANDSAELARICRLSPDAIIRELAYKDASFGDLPGSTAADAPRRDVHVSKAAKPAPTLGRKATQGKDEMTSAIENNDLDAFNRLELARRRGR